MDGMVLKVDRGSKHDGPGLRTVVFLKGCPLRCQWCSTPDSQRREKELLHIEANCVMCGRCVDACPEKAVVVTNGGICIARERCNLCGACVAACHSKGNVISGILMTVEEAYEIVERSRPFFIRMSGGLTISGGEVFYQFDFTKALLKKCHDAGIDTNIETSAFAPTEKVRELLPYLDHVCCDAKHMDDAIHTRLTGVSNRQIHENIRMISYEKDLILRFPVIPTCNDSEENIFATADFAKTLGAKFNRIDLLPYHEMGVVTYKRLGRNYPLGGIPVSIKEAMERVKAQMVSLGVNAELA